MDTGAGIGLMPGRLVRQTVRSPEDLLDKLNNSFVDMMWRPGYLGLPVPFYENGWGDIRGQKGRMSIKISILYQDKDKYISFSQR